MALPRRAKRGPAECRQRQSRTRAQALHALLAGWAMPSCANLPKGHTQTRPTTGQTRPRYNIAVPTPYSCRYGWGGVRKPCRGRTYPCLKAGAPGPPACQRGRGKRARRRRTWRTGSTGSRRGHIAPAPRHGGRPALDGGVHGVGWELNQPRTLSLRCVTLILGVR